MNWYYFLDVEENIIEFHRIKDDALAIERAREIARRLGKRIGVMRFIGGIDPE